MRLAFVPAFGATPHVHLNGTDATPPFTTR
jgi:hypothetical protein